jgi:hypothetical protein
MLCINPTHNGDHSTVTIKEPSRVGDVDGSIVDFLTPVSKRKRWESLNNQDDADVDHIVYTTSPSQKRSASSSTRNSISISSYHTELRDEPVDYLSLDEDYETTSLVSIFRQVSPESSPVPLKNNDNNLDEEDNSSYPEFPTLARARTITDPTDGEYDELFFSNDPPDIMVDSSRLPSPSLEELLFCHQDKDNWSTDYCARYEEKVSIEKACENVNKGWLASDTTSSGASSAK